MSAYKAGRHCVFFFFSSRRRHTRCSRDWSSDVCSSDLEQRQVVGKGRGGVATQCPAEGVLATAASDDQYSHLFLNASVNAWAARLAESTTSFTTAFASFI